MPATSEILNRPCVSERIAQEAHAAFPGEAQKQRDMREAFLRGARAAMLEMQIVLVEQRARLGRAEANHAR